MTKENDVSFYKEGDLFREVPNDKYHDLMACVGRNGGPYDFEDYSIGYFDAARRLWASVQDNDWNADVIIYPLAFLYRQGIELALKHLCRFLAAVYRSGDSPELTHGLTANWQIVRSLLELHAVNNPYRELEGIQLDAIERLLHDFETLDADSFVFRYPASKRGDLYLQDQSRIDLIEMNRVLDAASHWFVDVCAGVKEDVLT